MFIKAKLSLQKGSSWKDKYKLFILSAYTSRKAIRPLLQPLIRLFSKDKLIKLSFRPESNAKPVTIFIRKDHFNSDFLSLSELALFNCYKLPVKFNPDIIIDGGGNTGLFTLICSVIYPSQKVLLFEPVKANLDLINRHLLNNNNRCEVFEGLLSLKTEEVPFYIRNANNSSLDPSLPYSSSINIKSFSLPEVLNRYDFDNCLVKLDIEGAEMQVIPDLLEKFQDKNFYIVGELHDWSYNLEILRAHLAKYQYEINTYDEDSNCLLFHIYKN